MIFRMGQVSSFIGLKLIPLTNDRNAPWDELCLGSGFGKSRRDYLRNFDTDTQFPEGAHDKAAEKEPPLREPEQQPMNEVFRLISGSSMCATKLLVALACCSGWRVQGPPCGRSCFSLSEHLSRYSGLFRNPSRDGAVV